MAPFEVAENVEEEKFTEPIFVVMPMPDILASPVKMPPGWITLDCGASRSVASLFTLEEWQSKLMELFPGEEVMWEDATEAIQLRFGNGGVLRSVGKISMLAAIGDQGER